MYSKTPEWLPGRFDVAADMALLQTLTKDMEACSNSLHVPAPWWMLPQELARGSMAELMVAWCGDVGQLLLSDSAQIAKVSGSTDLIGNYEAFVRSIDHRQFLQGIGLSDLGDANWRVMDLGSLMDYLLISAFLDLSQERVRILEIGGGFGRLAEFFSMVGGPQVQYVNIDAVPVSLMYCYQYLKSRFPERKVMVFSPDQDLASGFDFLIVPAWHVDKLPLVDFDLGINVESMQEMSQELVDYYLDLLDKKIRSDGMIYLVNSREYKFRGIWNIPDRWQCEFRHRTPRSWTANHPAEIFRRTTRNQAGQNMLRTAAYARELVCHEELQEIRKQPRYTQFFQSGTYNIKLSGSV